MWCRRRFACIIVAYAIFCVARPAAAQLLVDDVPLPNDVRVETPDSSVPDTHKRFLGGWIGVWGGTLHHLLIVEAVSSDGNARVIYAWGDSSQGRTARGWRRYPARVNGATLEIAADFGAAYHLVTPVTANATWQRGDSASRARMWRVDIAGLTAAGARPWSSYLPTSLAAEPTLAKGFASPSYVPMRPDRGILLYLHGCDGLNVRGWTQAWLDHFEVSGFRVFAPDSFAEKRPAAACGRQPAELYDVRVMQTLRALDLLRREYPAVPIYMWGHSEGAAIAYRINERIAGILTTGHQCGILNTGRISVHKDVRLLVLMGNPRHDKYLPAGIEQSSLCQRTMKYPRWRWKQFLDVGHLIPIWKEDVLREVNEFFAIDTKYFGTDARMGEDGPAGMTINPRVERVFAEAYKKIELQKAFAIGSLNVYGYSFNAASELDAKTSALYLCNSVLHPRDYQAGQRCLLYAINDRIVFNRH